MKKTLTIKLNAEILDNLQQGESQEFMLVEYAMNDVLQQYNDCLAGRDVEILTDDDTVIGTYRVDYL